MFIGTKADHRIFVYGERHLMISVYIDDLFVVGENQEKIN